MSCDGSGILEERYIDVDQTYVVECAGCEACDEVLAEIAAEQQADAQLDEMLEASPLWAGEPAVYEVRPMVAVRELLVQNGILLPGDKVA